MNRYFKKDIKIVIKCEKMFTFMNNQIYAH